MKRHKVRHKGLLGVAVLAATAAVLLLPMGATAIVAGAGYTTTNAVADGPGTCFNGPGVVNCNIYAEKEHVWINGGPTNGTSALSDGTYFFVVGVPGGENSDINDAATVPDDGTGTAKNLSDDFDAYTNRTFTVVNHHISGTSGTHDFVDGKIRLAPYSDTTNPGGEYFVALCRIDQAGYPAEPSACKYDNFKVRVDTPCDPEDPEGDCQPPTPFGVVSGLKYYDANANGTFDGTDVGIPGWPIDFTDGVANTVITGAGGEFTVNLPPDTYTFAEEHPLAPTTWTQTGNTSGQFLDNGGNSTSLNSFIYTTIVVNGGVTSGLNFGNLCVGAGGGLTLGFWSNKNGQALVGPTDLALLVGLNLRNGNGTAFDPATAKALSTWLLNATAVNMAYMLSAQLAAMELNVFNGFVNGNALIYAPGTTSANALGYATVNAVMAEANADLLVNNITTAAGAVRTHQEALKNALDRGNNNLNFVQSGPGSCPTPAFPS